MVCCTNASCNIGTFCAVDDDLLSSGVAIGRGDGIWDENGVVSSDA